MISPSIRIIVVSYNGRETLRECLLSIPNTLVCTVVDNASSDGSAEMVATDFPHIHLIESPNNIGFGAANNLALEKATEDYILFLNPDVVLEPDIENLLYRSAMLPDLAVCGFNLRHADGRLQLSFGMPANLLSEMIRRTWQRAIDRRSRWAQHLCAWTLGKEKVLQASWVCGAALLSPRDLLNLVEGFDESYFLYFEDIDLCFRLKSHGRIYLDTRVCLLHYGGVSAGASEGLAGRSYRDSQKIFWRKWGSPLSANLMNYYVNYIEWRILREGQKI